MTVRFLATAIILMAMSGGARAECGADNWKDCAGKPWVHGAHDTPVGEKWWPSALWGADDEAGSTNWYTRPEVVLRALAEADKGRVYNLGHPYRPEMPKFGGRGYKLETLNPTDGKPLGGNATIYFEEMVTSEIGQVGTQFDGLAHIAVSTDGSGDPAEVRFYNGFTQADIQTDHGHDKIGVEKLHPIVARGVLIDVAGARGVAMLEAGYVITMDDVRAALAGQGMADFKFEPGDAVFFHTGWGQLWENDVEKFLSGEPGIGMEVADWLGDEVKVGVVGADNWGTEAFPTDPACAFCIVHTNLILRHGIVNQEGMKLDELVRDKVYTFLYMFTPVPLAGATGSPGAPIAID